MRPEVRDWFDRRTSATADWPMASVQAAKGELSIDVILPALNEEETVGAIVTQIRSLLMSPDMPLVDDLVVVDSGSWDRTASVAAAAGARVVHREDVLPGFPIEVGKGEAMWRGLAATSGDLVVFIDADLRSVSADYVTGRLGPLLADETVQLVKSVYERPFVEGDSRISAGGGRVTEVMARPLLNALWPRLSGVAQPLSGEYAARRSLLETLPFPCGYGVEIGLLIDTLQAEGLDSIAQVDLGERIHRHQDATGLALMSAQILHAALSRADQAGSLYATVEDPALPMFDRDLGRVGLREESVQTLERPPLLTIPEYASSHGTWTVALADSAR